MPTKVVTLYAAGNVQLRKLTDVADAMAAYSANEVSVEAVTSLEEMAKHQIQHLPAVAVDGVVMCSGRMPEVDELRAWVNPPEPA